MNDRTSELNLSTNAKGSPFEITTFETGEICPICGEKLRRVRSIYGEHTLNCKCEEEKLEREKAERIANGQKLVREQMQKNAGIGQRWRGKTFANFYPRPNQRGEYDAIRGWAAAYDPKKTTEGLLLCGAVGVGKTHLATAIANSVIANLSIDEYTAKKAEESGRYENSETPAIVISTVELLSRVRRSFDKKNSDKDNDLIERVKNVRLLILDDLGVEQDSGWVRETLFEIVNHRYSEELPIIITTNATPEELKNQVGARTFDRIREMCAFINFDGQSYRKTASVEQIRMV